jgi:peroxisomal membrane protein 2
MKVFSLLSVFTLLVGTSTAFVTPRQSSVTKTTTAQTSSLNVAGAQEAWTAYNDALQADPLLVKSVTAGVILGAADIAGQAVQNKLRDEDADAEELDIGRTARFAFFGLVLQAPWNHFYFMTLDGAIPPTAEPFTSTNGIKV